MGRKKKKKAKNPFYIQLSMFSSLQLQNHHIFVHSEILIIPYADDFNQNSPSLLFKTFYCICFKMAFIAILLFDIFQMKAVKQKGSRQPNAFLICLEETCVTIVQS